MQLYRLHSFILCNAEGDVPRAHELCSYAGLDITLHELFAHSVSAGTTTDAFVDCLRAIADDGGAATSMFWRSLARWQLGALATEPELRALHFGSAKRMAEGIPHASDQTYITMLVNAGLHDTPGAKVDRRIDDVFDWMLRHGAYHTPGRALALARKLLANDMPASARDVYDKLFMAHRRTTFNAHFSPRQMAAFEAWVRTTLPTSPD